MLVIELRFPAGRYHANPWGRNVNEGEVEWPPSPYRLARALIDVWKRRRPEWSTERMRPILKALGRPPVFCLPEANSAHTRSYLNSNQKDPFAQQLIFDAFVTLDRQAKVSFGFDCDLSPESVQDLDALLKELNFFGRSESWVKAGVSPDTAEPTWNCTPYSDGSTGGTVRVACLLSEADYNDNPMKPESTDWMDAICLTTRELLKAGWSSPPALSWVDYQRPSHSFGVLLKPEPAPLRSKFRYAKYALHATVLPRIQETVSVAERVRAFLMGIHKKVQGDDPSKVSQVFSGKTADGRPLKGHRHAFFLPTDEDGDGRIDHLTVNATEPFSATELQAIDRLRSVWQSRGRPDIDLVLVSLSAEMPKLSSRKWVSATPFVTARHHRKGRGTYEEWLAGEIIRECGFHGLPEPVRIDWISHTQTTKKPVRWIEFVRRRKDKSALRGHGCILTFEQPVEGPFVLGSACHFGLGLFEPHT